MDIEFLLKGAAAQWSGRAKKSRLLRRRLRDSATKATAGERQSPLAPFPAHPYIAPAFLDIVRR
jgi:hypothetical protein